MPTFQGQLSEEQLLQLVAFLKSLAPQQGGAAGQPSAAAQAPGGASGR
jgi:hypothetical protein